MKLLDSGSRDPEDALASWFIAAAKDGIAGLYIQTGYFSIGSLDLLVSTCSAEALLSCEVQILIGSNDPRTYGADVLQLSQLLGIPRDKAKLAVIAFADGLYHPKAYLIRRKDGSLTAYIGSANLTTSGLAKNVELGIVLDTKVSKDVNLTALFTSMDRWFKKGKPEGIHLISDAKDVQSLIDSGVLSATPPPPKIFGPYVEGKLPTLPKLKPLVKWPKLASSTPQTAGMSLDLANPASGVGHPVVTLKLDETKIGTVLIAETTQGRPGSSGHQVDLKKDIAESYFGGVSTTVNCIRLGKKGEQSPVEHRKIGTKASKNWYVELSGLIGQLAPGYENRPLLIMGQSKDKKNDYQYFWLYPTDENYGKIYNQFIKQVGRKGKQSIKVLKSYTDLEGIWPDNPFQLTNKT